MDIIASHQSGLIEQYEAEATALAGRARDGGMRAIVYHHVADRTGLNHVYALLAAHGALAIDPAIAKMERQARRAWWRVSQAERAALAERIATFGGVVRALDGERCAAVLMAYRMAATPGLSGEAARRIDAELLAALAEVQRAGRRSSEQRGAVRRRLFVAHAAWIEQVMAGRLDAAVVALDWPLGRSAMRAAIAALRIPVAAYDQAERRGMKRIEAVLRKAKILPAPFATNPAQAFFALQRLVSERRRQAADGDHLSPDDAISMAA